VKEGAEQATGFKSAAKVYDAVSGACLSLFLSFFYTFSFCFSCQSVFVFFFTHHMLFFFTFT
jgi:hypothetical protein